MNELSVGAQWNDETDVQLPFVAGSPISGKTLKNKYLYELKRIKKKKGKLLAEIVVNVNSIVTDLAKAAGHVSQESKGQVWFDSDDGMVRSMEMFTEQVLEVKIQNQQVQGRNTNKVEQNLLTVTFPQASADTESDE